MDDAAVVARRGVVWAALLAFMISVMWAVVTPAFWGVDETSHVAYAVRAADGDWPTVDTPNPAAGFPGLDDRLAYDVASGRLGRLDVWTANHPPLYFLTVGLPLRAGVLAGQPGAGMLVARLLTAAGGASGVLAVGWLARLVAPRRPRVAVVAAAVAALCPTLTHYAGQIFNDTLAFTLSGIGLAAGFSALRSGITGRRVFLGGLAAGAGALTRSSGFAVAAVAGVAFLLAAWWDDAGAPVRARLRSVVVTAAQFGGLVTVVSGWAVAVNVLRYGDPTGAAVLFTKFDRLPGPAWWRILSAPRYHVDQVDRLVAELSIGVWWPGTATRLAWVVVTLAIAGGVVAGVRRAVGTPRSRGGAAVPSRRTGPGRSRARSAAVGALTVALPVLLLVASAVFVSRGGYPHSRYLLPGLGCIATLVALGLDGHPRRWSVVPCLVGLGLLALANVALTTRFLTDHPLWYREVLPPAALESLAPTWVGLLVGVIGGVTAFAGVVRCLLAVGSVDPVGAGPERGRALHEPAPGRKSW